MCKWQPSVFTRSFSRFTNQKSAELAETEHLYDRGRRLHSASPYAAEDACTKLAWQICSAFYDRLAEPLRMPVCEAVYHLLALEDTIFDLPDFHPRLSLT